MKSFNELLAEHQDIVSAAINKYAFRTAPEDRDDISQDALCGLLKASKTFKEGAGASFRTFASIKIRGAILDGIEQRSYGHRVRFREVREYGQVQNRIYRDTGMPATRDQVARELDKSESQLPRIRTFIPLERPSDSNESDESSMHFHDMPAPDSTEDSADLERTAQRIVEALVTRTEVEQDIFIGFYYRGEKMTQLAKHHGITLSAASEARIRVERHVARYVGASDLAA